MKYISEYFFTPFLYFSLLEVCVAIPNNDIIRSLKGNFSLLTYEQYESLMIFERSVAKAEFARINCAPGSNKSNSCLKCICGDNGIKWNCKSFINKECSWGTYEGQIQPSDDNFTCNPKTLMFDYSFYTCTYCKCGDNGKTVDCIYERHTECIPVLNSYLFEKVFEKQNRIVNGTSKEKSI